LGLEDNTLVVFTSDNGSPHVSNEPLRGAKGGYYEGGIRVPMVVRWPGIVAAGSTCDTPVTNVDFYPTFMAAIGAAAPITPLDGESLLPLFKNQGELKRDSVFWHFPGYLDAPVLRGRDSVFRTRPVSVIRKGNLKLHLYHEEWQLDGGREKIATNRAVELYDLAVDPGEHHKIATHTAAISWHGEDGSTFAEEIRKVTVYNIPGGTQLDWSTNLTTMLDLVRLDGDPQHSGFHFRAAQEVAQTTVKQTYYLRPDGKGKEGEARNWDSKKKVSEPSICPGTL
jgi:arylsulfatase A-like enzyme